MNLDLILYREIEKAISESHEKIALGIISGKAHCYDDYKYRVGQINGLQIALKLAKESHERISGVPKKEN